MNSLNFQVPLAGSEMSQERVSETRRPMLAPFAPSTAALGASGRQRALVSAATIAVQAIFVIGLALGLAHEATTQIAPPMAVAIFPEEEKEFEPPPPPPKPLLQQPQVVMNLPPPVQIYTPPPIVQVNAPPSPITSQSVAPTVRIDPNPAIVAFQMDMLRKVNRNLRYPQSSRVNLEEGVVLVRFTMDRKGNVSNVAVEKSSEFPLLNDEAVAVLLRAQPFPPPPPELAGDKIDMVLPVKFSLRGPGGFGGRRGGGRDHHDRADD